MRISLLVTTFNSLSQALFCLLRDGGHRVDVTYAINETQMQEEIDAFAPDIVIAPYLKRFIPETIFARYPTYVLHPGPVGDRGAYALEHAVWKGSERWGITLLCANAVFDGGEVVESEMFAVTGRSKADIYRIDVPSAMLRLMARFTTHWGHKEGMMPPKRPMHAPLRQEEICIDWMHDSTDVIIRKVGTLDSFPGVRDEILGVKVELFGAHREAMLGKDDTIAPKTVLAKRDGAICLKSVDGAVWISHLKEPHRFKLPATYVLKERLKGIKEMRLPLIFDKSYATFYEVSAEIEGNVGYLHFDFHNGAMSSAQCMRLKYAFEYLASQCDVVVLRGGRQFFSNGIHLNILEDSQKQGEDGWENINAMNDLVGVILQCTEAITVASLERNAGAGGVFLALACDKVIAREGVVLNPHYKTLGLSGSEYHTYTLPRRVGDEEAQQLLDACLPVSATYAKKIGMIDAVLSDEEYEAALKRYCAELGDDEALDDWLWEKEERIEAQRAVMEACKEAELRTMYPQFWEETSPFHRLRREFVYKVCPRQTPKRLKNEEVRNKK